MIEKLTLKKLKEYGYDEEDIEEFKNDETKEQFLFITSEKAYWATNIEKKIYSNIDAWRKFYFRNEMQIYFPEENLDLIPEYYQNRYESYIKEQREIARTLFNKKQAEVDFKEKEIAHVKEAIKVLKEKEEHPCLKKFTYKEIQRLEWYLNWLNGLNIDRSTQKLEVAVEEKGFIQKPLYKKHPDMIGLFRLPSEILKLYSNTCLTKYEYKTIIGFGKIPFPSFSLSSVEDNKVILDETCLQAYAKGFIDGYKDDLVPFIDTPENRKEMILVEIIRKGGKGFVAHKIEGETIYLPEEMYESGLFEGKRYKAWHYIFDAPLSFIDLFKGKDENSSQDKNKKPIVPQTLQDVFISNKAFKDAVKALKAIKVIDENNVNLIGSKLKGVMQVWIGILRTDRQQLRKIDDKELTILLNKYFVDLNLSEKTDGKHLRNSINKTASNKYRAKLLAIIQ